MDDHTDQILSTLSQQGAKLHAMLLRITLREGVAEDLMQELFLRLYRRRDLHRIRNLEAYLMTAATRLAFDWRRSQRRRRDGARLDIDPATSSAGPTMEIELRDELDKLLEDVGRLPVQMRQLIVLRYLEECSYEDISNMLDKTPHQVRALCHKAITKLRKMQIASAKTGTPARNTSHE